MRVKSRDLPLHWFDRAFCTLGPLLLLGLWAARAAATLLAPRSWRARRDAVMLLWLPAGFYFASSALRVVPIPIPLMAADRP